MIKFIVPAKDTWFVRGSSPDHPNALDFGFRTSVPGSQNQSLISGVHGADEVRVARKRFASDGGNIIDIRVETPTNTIYVSFMHMLEQSPLPVGTLLSTFTVVGRMGTTGSSIGEHVHIIMAVCPKGTSVEDMYSYRVDPKPYYYYLEGYTNSADNEMPWTTLDEAPPSSTIKPGSLVTIENSTEVVMGKQYEVIKVNGKEITMREVEQGSPSYVGKTVTLKKGAYLYDSKGNQYKAPTTTEHSIKIEDQINDLLGFRASWLQGVSKAYAKIKDVK